MNCSSTEPKLMEMMSLLTRLGGPESPPWTSSDSIPLPFIPSVSSYAPRQAVLALRGGDAREGHILSFHLRDRLFPPMMLSPRAPIPQGWESLEGEPGAYTTCSLMTWEGGDGQTRSLITFPGVAKPRGVGNPGEKQGVITEGGKTSRETAEVAADWTKTSAKSRRPILHALHGETGFWCRKGQGAWMQPMV